MDSLPQLPGSEGEQLRVPRIRVMHAFVWLGLAIVLVSLDSMASAMQISPNLTVYVRF